MMENNGKKKYAFIFFVAWLAVTMLWWAFAFMPLSSSSPAWLEQAQNFCFGSYNNGLPDTRGWFKLLSPLSMLAILLTVWVKSCGSRF